MSVQAKQYVDYLKSLKENSNEKVIEEIKKKPAPESFVDYWNNYMDTSNVKKNNVKSSKEEFGRGYARGASSVRNRKENNVKGIDNKDNNKSITPKKESDKNYKNIDKSKVPNSKKEFEQYI